ncbi:efflux transporter outer membrane subunit [Acetobacteraceae bacterium KSS12]|uniref:Efflux transporter outer membrane subunit n=2 Tax=Rhizosaccharibacter radicis TaxID=2782605 RepID=A0ABT1W1K0_9PROT|nr:efflux transporter outer membrane subunit [Acetobacteraceae bacterium KSS12]
MLGLAMLLAGCKVGPAYRAPTAVVPGNWSEHRATAEELARTQARMRRWWGSFDDPMLDRLVDRTIRGNYDLQIAGERLLAARALRDQIASQLYPQVDVLGAGGIQRYSTTLQYPPLPGISSDNRLWEYGTTVSWQLDLFGRLRRSVEAQDAAVQAGVEQRRGLLLSTLAEVASDYCSLRVTQQQLGIAKKNIAAADDALKLTQKVYTQGLGTTLQVAQAQAQLETEQATVQPLQTRIAQLSHALAILAGELPASFEAELAQPASPPTVPALPVALPSAVIANRPDIRERERQFAQATARVGVAVAQLYPSFTLPLSFTPMASMVHELFTASSLAWSALLQASIPVYHGGGLAAQVREARANAEAARLSYQNTVLHAFGEVEDRLVAFNNDAVRADTLHKAARDDALALDRARRLYAAGLSGFLDVLTAERSAYAGENAAALGELARMQDAIALFVALGAGWQGVDLHDNPLPVDEQQQHAEAAAHRTP